MIEVYKFYDQTIIGKISSGQNSPNDEYHLFGQGNVNSDNCVNSEKVIY